MSTPTDRTPALSPPADSPRDTRERLIDAITVHGPITARALADRFGLTSAAVRRHLATLQAEGVICEHERPAGPRGRGRPSKSFVAAARPRESSGEETGSLARMALDLLERVGGAEALDALAAERVAPWEDALAQRVAEAEARGERIGPGERLDLLASLLTERGYATTVRPLTVTVPSASSEGSPVAARPRTVVTAQLCQGHCPVQEVAARHPELCDLETRAISRMLGVPVQRLATLAGGAHACTTHIPLTEGRTP